jgi:hypothetical protein
MCAECTFPIDFLGAVIAHVAQSSEEVMSRKSRRFGDDLVEAFEEMAAHLRGEIECESYELDIDILTAAVTLRREAEESAP